MIHVNSSKSSAMFSRRHREVIQTSVILILIVALGYGFYLYNLLQVRAEHLSLKSQRYQSQHQALSSQLQTVYEERSRLENSFQKEKLEHQNTKDELQEVKNQNFNNMREQQKDHESQYKELHAQHERVKSELEEAQQTIEEVKNEKALVELHKQQKIDRLNEMLGSKSTSEQELIDLKKDMEILSADHQQAKQQNADMQSSYNQSQEELMKYNKLKLILKEVGADTLQMGHPKLNQLNADNRKILFEHFGGSDNVMQMENLHQKAGEEQQQRLQAIQRQQEEKLRRDQKLNARKQLSETLLENDNHPDDQILGAQENSEQSQQQVGNSENDPQIDYNALSDEQNKEKKSDPNTADIMGNQGDDSQVNGDTKIQEVHDIQNERSSQETTNKVLEELTTQKSSHSEIKEINDDSPVINSEHLNKNDVVDSDKNDHSDDQSQQNGIEQIESQAKAEEELALLELREHASDIEDADNKLEKLKQLQIAQEQVVDAQGKQIDEYVKRNKENHLGGDMDIRGQIFEEEDARLNDEIERTDDGDNDDDEADEDDAQVDVPPAGKVAAQEPEMVVNAPKVNEGRDDTNHGEDEYEHYNGEQNQEEEENFDEDDPNKRQPARQVVNDQDQYDPDNDEEEQQAVDERHQAALEDADRKAYQKREM